MRPAGFLVLLLTLDYFTALMFLVLLQSAEEDDDDTVAGFSGGTFASLGGFTRALASSFDMTILGARCDASRPHTPLTLPRIRAGTFSPGAFDASAVPWLARLLFMVVMLLVMVRQRESAGF